jgi:hypothetical protein
MIELTNQQILSINQSINNLRESKVILNIKASYKLARIKKIIQSFTDTIQQEQMELYRKYGESEEDGRIRIPPEKTKEFAEEFEELMKINNNIEIDPIDIDEFGDIDIDFNIMDGLMDILTERI